MKNIRIFYKKQGRLRFISHLDMTRFMTRVLRKTDIPAWYTEGFNKHLYMNFALPLTLGFVSEYEALDIKLYDDDYPIEKVISQINEATPDDLIVFDAHEPENKCSEISFARFVINFPECDLTENLKSFFSQKQIICEKKSKKGILNQIDISEKIKDFDISFNGDTILKIVLPAGNSDNINPTIILSAFEKFSGDKLPYYEVTRSGIFTENMLLFR